MASKKRLLPTTEKLPVFGITAADCGSKMSKSTYNDFVGVTGTIPTLQEITGNIIRKHVAEERKDIVRKHSETYQQKRTELELQKGELQRKLQEVEEQMQSMEIDCHKEMLTELDRFDNEKQPEMLDVLWGTGQPDRICPLCEKYFRSSTDLPACCLGRDQCHLHTVQRCCFSCSRLSFHDIFQCLATSSAESNKGGDEPRQGLGIIDDLSIIDGAASTPSWMLDQIFGEGAEIIRPNEEDEYEKSTTAIAVAAMRLVPSESGSVTCPVCLQLYCDHDFLYHFAACCRQAQENNKGAAFCLEVSE
mmetsp:Transcript_34251/g.71627  ORF Transcript_34251/g.71627 Transcript_34251/m.71627 type:complete len:305 (-) Transcript_34251:407-1321(-)